VDLRGSEIETVVVTPSLAVAVMLAVVVNTLALRVPQLSRRVAVGSGLAAAAVPAAAVAAPKVSDGSWAKHAGPFTDADVAGF
jgi:hypothetical protein